MPKSSSKLQMAYVQIMDDIMHKILRRGVFLLVLVLFAGCRNPLTDYGADYSSRIYAIYADNPKNTLLFFGEKYQYIFPHVDANLATLLEQKDDLGYSIGNTYSSANLEIKIDILANKSPYLVFFIYFEGDQLSDTQKRWLAQHGFETQKKKSPDVAAIYAFNDQLNGKRYREDLEKIDMLEPLSETPMLLQGRDFSYQKNPHVTKSPVSIGVDGVRYKEKRFTPIRSFNNMNTQIPQK